MDLKNFFERVYCINLDRRPDRWKQFIEGLPADWPFKQPERWPAVDGKKCPPPPWWSQGGGAWGCYRSHLQIIEKCLNEGVESVLILEDDAICCEGFRDKVQRFLEALPSDWGMLYLGGQHLFVRDHPPKAVNEHVFRPYNVNRTHAYALRGEVMRAVYRHLCRNHWKSKHHIDHHYGTMHMEQKWPIYCPGEWLVGQREGASNIAGREYDNPRFWPNAADVAKFIPDRFPFVAVVGLHSSGSSCLAGVLHHLGIHMGNTFVGYYGRDPNNPDKKCGFEAIGLAQICEWAIPFPVVGWLQPESKITDRLREWINARRREAAERRTIAGGKYPLLCRLGNPLRAVCGDQLRVIVSERPVDESIQSLIRREGSRRDPEQLELHQRWLEAGKRKLVEAMPSDRVLVVPYHELLTNPRAQVERICAFLQISPTEEQIQRAVEWPQPRHCHVKLEPTHA